MSRTRNRRPPPGKIQLALESVLAEERAVNDAQKADIAALEKRIGELRTERDEARDSAVRLSSWLENAKGENASLGEDVARARHVNTRLQERVKAQDEAVKRHGLAARRIGNENTRLQEELAAQGGYRVRIRCSACAAVPGFDLSPEGAILLHPHDAEDYGGPCTVGGTPWPYVVRAEASDKTTNCKPESGTITAAQVDGRRVALKLKYERRSPWCERSEYCTRQREHEGACNDTGRPVEPDPLADLNAGGGK